jgi:Uma2 family endonuclease
MTQPQRVKTYTPEEYFRLEHQAEFKSDYYKGEIFAMSGGTTRHSRICGNIIGEAWGRLKGTPCSVFESNQRLTIKATGLRTYPDVSVYCQKPEVDEIDPHRETVLNPTVLFEVLSKSTEGYDRGFKSENYRQIPSLKAYILVSKTRPHVEMLERQQNGDWTLKEVSGLNATLGIPAIGIELPLAEIYYKVDFNANDDQEVP